MSRKLTELRNVNTDVDIGTVVSTTFQDLANFGLVHVPEGGIVRVNFIAGVDTSVATDTVGIRIQANGVDVNVSPRLIDIGFVNQANNVNVSFSCILSDVNGGPIAAGPTTIVVQGNRSSGSGTITFIDVSASLEVYSTADTGRSSLGERQDQGSSLAPLGQGGNPLQQRGDPYPGGQPYR